MSGPSAGPLPIRATGVRVTQPEGSSWEHRVIAKDRQGNVARSAPRSVSVPLDDDGSTVEYAGSWVLDTSDSAEAYT